MDKIEEILLSPEQESKLSSFMAEHPEVSRKLALRFLIGRKWETERVRKLYANYKRTAKERGLSNVTLQDVLEEMRTQKMYIPGSRARDRSALFVIWGARHVPSQFSLQQTIKLAFYLSQVGVGEDLLTQQKGLCLIVNLEDVSWANSDVGFLKSIVDFFTDNIPAAVKHIVIWKAPWWIGMVAKMMLPFLKEKMRLRVIVTDDPQALLGIVSDDQLPNEFPNGTFQYDHLAHIEKELSKISIAKEHLKHVEPTASPLIVEPIGVEHYIPDELASKLRDERRLHFEELRIKVQALKSTLRSGHSVLVQDVWLGSTRRGRLSMDPSGIDQACLPINTAESALVLDRDSAKDPKDDVARWIEKNDSPAHARTQPPMVDLA